VCLCVCVCVYVCVRESESESESECVCEREIVLPCSGVVALLLLVAGRDVRNVLAALVDQRSLVEDSGLEFLNGEL
jgi:hypothetical protein